jgi:hypothetical protein
MYFQSMAAGMNIVNGINGASNFEKYIFYTSFGTIIGKPKELFQLEFNSEEKNCSNISRKNTK